MQPLFWVQPDVSKFISHNGVALMVKALLSEGKTLPLNSDLKQEVMHIMNANKSAVAQTMIEDVTRQLMASLETPEYQTHLARAVDNYLLSLGFIQPVREQA